MRQYTVEESDDGLSCEKMMKKKKMKKEKIITAKTMMTASNWRGNQRTIRMDGDDGSAVVSNNLSAL